MYCCSRYVKRLHANIGSITINRDDFVSHTENRRPESTSQQVLTGVNWFRLALIGINWNQLESRLKSFRRTLSHLFLKR